MDPFFQVIERYYDGDPIARVGLYQRWRRMPAQNDDKRDLERLLSELPDDAARDLGLAAAMRVFLEFVNVGAKPPHDSGPAAVRSAVLGPELHEVAHELNSWVKRTYTVDKVSVVSPASPTGALFVPRTPGSALPPLILLGRLVRILAQHYHVDTTREWWVVSTIQFWTDEYAAVWPMLALWLVGWVEDPAKHEEAQGRIPGLCLDFAAEWCGQGFAQVVVHQPLAAAFALTDVPASMLDGCELPWDAFRIVLPKSPIVLEGVRGPERFDELWCWRTSLRRTDDAEQHLWLLGGSSERIDAAGNVQREWWHLTSKPRALGQLCDSPQNPFLDSDLEELGVPDDVRRVATAAFHSLLNIFLCTTLHLTQGHHERAPAKKPPKGHRWRAPKSQPLTTDFVLGPDVKLSGPNLAPVVEAICRGERKFGKVQWVVRGHQRWQAHGPQHSLRKLIWVQPYWKGPVDAPILKRSHEMEDR